MDGALCGTDAGNAVDLVGVVGPDAFFGGIAGFGGEIVSGGGGSACAVGSDCMSGAIGGFISGPNVMAWFELVDPAPPSAAPLIV